LGILVISFSFPFFVVLGLEFRAFTLSHSTSPFCDGYFWDRVSWTICLSWLQTVILLISASWVARITGVSHWHLAENNF
jgi:ABC-type Fe3+ transport system permease subunit